MDKIPPYSIKKSLYRYDTGFRVHILLELCGRRLFFCFLEQPGAGLRRKIK